MLSIDAPPPPLYETKLLPLGTLSLVFLNFGIQRFHGSSTGPGGGDVVGLARRYLSVYVLLMAADWVQTPYLWGLYHEYFGEQTITTLFACGFASGGIAAPFIGVWADHHGRKTISLLFCVAYSVSCLAILFPTHPPILLLGRLVSGISTPILFGIMESWLVSECNSLDLAPGDLSGILGNAAVLRGFVSTSAGVASNHLVSLTGLAASPFAVSGVMLVLACLVVGFFWGENYGVGGRSDVYAARIDARSGDVLQLERLNAAFRVIIRDPILLTIGLTQVSFEASMYLFVLLWVPHLQESAARGTEIVTGEIFAAFMFSMMVGSLLYTVITSTTREKTAEASLVLHARLSAYVCLVGAAALATSVHFSGGRTRYWAFCVFEACVGVYFPVQGMLRASQLYNEHRATLSSLYRVPLNIIIVYTLTNGLRWTRYNVFTGCAAFLTLSALLTRFVVYPKVEVVLVATRVRDQRTRYWEMKREEEELAKAAAIRLGEEEGLDDRLITEPLGPT